MTDFSGDQRKANTSSPNGVEKRTSPKAVKGDDGVMSYYINGGILVTFPTATSEERQQDIQYSLLFAQYASDVKYNRKSDPEGWFTNFKYVLSNIGWATGSFKFDVDVTEGYFVFSSLILNLMAENDRPVESIATFRKFFNALHSLHDTDLSIELLYKNTYDSATYATSLILCSFSEISSKDVRLDVVMLGFGGLKEQAHRFLFHVYDSRDVTFDKAESCSVVLNEQVFAKVRETVVEKLGDRVKTDIIQVNI